MNPTITLPNANQLTGANSVEYANGGTIIVGAAQDYTGATILSGASATTNQLRAESRDAVSTSSIFISTALQTALIGDGGAASGLGASSSHAANLVFNGGTLQYSGAGASTDRLFTVGLHGGTIDASGTGPIKFTNTGAIVDDETGGAGNRTLTLAGSNAAANQISASIEDLSTSQISISKTGEGTWSLSGPLSYSGSTTVNAGMLSLATNLTASSGVTVTGGTLQLAPGGGSNRVIVAPTPTISGTGKIDLADNKMIVTTAGETGTWNGTAYDGVSGLVQSARGDGSWNGTTGITSSSAASNANPKLFSIGVVKVGDLHAGLADTDTTTFAGQTVHGSDTIAMYTYGGDANLDGKINIDDYGLIDSHVGQSGTAFGWHNGDFNYDGKINIDDYGIIDGNIGAQGAPIPASAQGLALTGGVSLGGVSAVPEPGSLAALSAMALMGVRRRRRLGQPAR
jgi:autotransporter-associated beta strand protein